MLGDFYTKPVQGGFYKKFRNSILGINQDDCFRYEQEYNDAKAKSTSSQS